MNYSQLQKCPLFHDMNEVGIHAALQDIHFHLNNYQKNEIIFGAMDIATQIGIILNGKVIIQKIFPNGKELNVTERTAGQLIGPAAVFSQSHRYPCDVISAVSSEILLFSKDQFLLLLHKNPLIMDRFITVFANAAYMLQERIELLSYSGIEQKIAFYLLIEARKTNSDNIPIPDSISKWASLMNVSRPSLHRELRKMEEKKWIHYHPPLITICNRNSLRALLCA